LRHAGSTRGTRLLRPRPIVATVRCHDCDGRWPRGRRTELGIRRLAKMTTAVIVQARMGSTRLPGKVLMRLAGDTVLAHVLNRCRAVQGSDAVCCATTDLPEDDAVAREAERAGARVYRGSAEDVLARYHGAAHALGCDAVLRVTAD